MKKCFTLPDKPIIAVDFDGTLTDGDNRVWISKHRYTNDIMVPNMKLIEKLKGLKPTHYIILWTCRRGKALKDAARLCAQHGLFFDAINRNIVSFPTSPKIYADYYIDDKNISVEEVDKNVLHK